MEGDAEVHVYLNQYGGVTERDTMQMTSYDRT